MNEMNKNPININFNKSFTKKENSQIYFIYYNYNE